MNVFLSSSRYSFLYSNWRFNICTMAKLQFTLAIMLQVNLLNYSKRFYFLLSRKGLGRGTLVVYGSPAELLNDMGALVFLSKHLHQESDSASSLRVS